jgi:hypothetical protein
VTGKALALSLAVALAAGCSTRNGLTPGGGAGTGGAAGSQGAGGSQGGGSGGRGGANGGSGGAATVFTIGIGGTLNRNLDILFMIDDSSSMSSLQTKLIEQFPAFMDVLKNLPGGLPNVHIGVVSSSMGAGRNPSIDHCPQGGDQGVLHTKPLGAGCAKASLLPGQNFIINVNGMANYTGDISDMFSCIALLGDGGCGFEHQLASVLRALGADGAPPPPQNANFLRPDAYLQIVLLTDEDDCSAPPDSALFDSTSSTISDPLGPLQSYRCNEFGHLCGGKPPPRQPMGEVDLSGTCVSAEDGRLLRISDVVTALKRLKADPSKIFVAAIASPKDPYKVNIGPSQVKGDPSMWPYVEHSCQQVEPNNSVTYGDPAVRIKQWTDGFGGNGVFESLCAPTLNTVLQSIAGPIGRVMGPPCFPANVDPATCNFVMALQDANGNTVSSAPLRRCTDASDPGPCWDVGVSSASCAQPIVLNHPPANAGSTTATCAP